ncbi:MAG: hypothetical protein HFJ68_05790 [Adlercreutzia caecimuris]|nr:hypothetical protein [Adlercreutzia caecimuris]
MSTRFSFSPFLVEQKDRGTSFSLTGRSSEGPRPPSPRARLTPRCAPQKLYAEEAGEDVTSERSAIAEQFAWQAMLSLNEQGTAVPADTSDVTVARYFHQVHRDFEDDLVLAAVERSGADYLITNDKKLRAHAPVAAITPADMLTLLKAADDA